MTGQGSADRSVTSIKLSPSLPSHTARQILLDINLNIRISEGMNILDMQENAERVSRLLKSLSNERRLMILCQLIDGEKPVGEIARSLEMRDAAASQQLSLLRKDRLVETRRDGQTIFYSVSRPDVRQLIEFLYLQFCETSEDQETSK